MKPTAIMIRAIVAFIMAFWCAMATIIFACHAIGYLAIITGIAAVLAALLSVIDYKQAEREYDNHTQ
jgi:hypothetical protein